MQTSDALRAYFGRVLPAVPELFNMAYAICGNFEQAEYSLQYALTEAWTGEFHGGMGFREGLRNTLREVAMEEALRQDEDAPEFTWDELTDRSDDPLSEMLAQESAETRRIAALRYGCGLPVGKVARLMGVTAAETRQTLERLCRKASRKLEAADRRRAEALLARSVRRSFAQADESMPSLSAVYRTFAAEAAEVVRPKHWMAKGVRRALYVLLLLVCAAAFWLTAALIQPVEAQPGTVAAFEMQ